VKVTPSILESINISAIFELPIIVLNTPPGAPLFCIILSISIPHCIVALAGFKTIVFPAINEGAANRNACQYGKFHGIILAITPKGWKVIIVLLASLFSDSLLRSRSPLYE